MRLVLLGAAMFQKIGLVQKVEIARLIAISIHETASKILGKPRVQHRVQTTGGHVITDQTYLYVHKDLDGQFSKKKS